MKSIIFNTEMVKAVLDGRKTQTRRVIPNKWIQSDKAPVPTHGEDGCIWHFWNFGEKQSKYKVDDILYVRETFGEYYQMCNHGNFCDCEPEIIYKSGKNYPYDTDCIKKWKPSIHMPKEYARIFLKVTNVRVEKIQDISMQDVLREGVSMQGNPNRHLLDTKSDWVENWNSKAKDGYKWEDNPYVFVYEFERISKED